jgi:hypothetical protein
MIYMALRFHDPPLARIPPMHLYPQLWWAFSSSLPIRLTHERIHSLRKGMNVAGFMGYLLGWTSKSMTCLFPNTPTFNQSGGSSSCPVFTNQQPC